MTSRHVAFWLAAASLLATLAILLLPAPGASASILVTDAIQDAGPAPRHACLVHEAFVQGNRIVAENPAAFAEIPCPPAAAKKKAGGRRRRV